jgi:hypothetical protein
MKIRPPPPPPLALEPNNQLQKTTDTKGVVVVHANVGQKRLNCNILSNF